MRIGKIEKSLVLTGFILGMGSLSNILVMAAPIVYRSNTYQPVMISRIVPAESYIEMTYYNLDNTTERLGYLNMQYGSMTDYDLYMFGIFSPVSTKTIFQNSFSALGPISMDDGGTLIKLRQSAMFPWINLLDNTEARIDYLVQYNFKKQWSRVDYSRCVNSSVFLSGEATECRMEELGNGFVQYQPYTSDGVRVEIPAEEDAELTRLTEEWRAEPGEWEDEWYESGDDDHEDDDENVGGGEGDSEGGEGGEGGSEGGESGSEGGEGGSEGGDGGSDDDVNNSGGTTSSIDDVSDNESKNNIEVEKENENSVVSIKTENRGNVEGSKDDSKTEIERGAKEKTEESVERGRDVIGRNFGEENSEDNALVVDQNQDTAQSKTDEDNLEKGVEVPNLGKEAEASVNLWPILIISGVAFVGLTVWAFLFFGKRNLIKRKEGKK